MGWVDNKCLPYLFASKQKGERNKTMNNFMNYAIPKDMENYLSFYGFHFNKALCEQAVSKMMREDKTSGEEKPIDPISLEELKTMLEKYKVDVDNNEWYDALYLANSAKADYLGSSIEDEEHLAKYIKDTLCDVDGYDGMIFTRFLADCGGKGEAIFWDMVL